LKLVNLFTGQKRLVLENYNSFKNIQLENKKNNFNFFVFWNDILITKEEENILKSSLGNYKYKIIDKDNFLKIYKNEFIKIKKDELLSKDDQNALIAWLHQYYILNEAFKFARNQLGKKSENYLWQRIRTDSYIPNKIKIEKILQDKKTLHFPGSKFGFGLNDFHCVGGFKSFKDYAHSINLLKILVRETIYLPPEILISTQLIRKKSLFTINRSLPARLLGIKNNKIYLRTFNSREKGYQYIDFNFSNYKSKKSVKDKSESFLISFLRRLIYLLDDIFQNLTFFIRR